MGTDDFINVVKNETTFADVMRECVDKCNIFMMKERDRHLLECSPDCKHCACHYLNKLCDGSCGGRPGERIEVNGMFPCPCVYDYVERMVRPGYVLLSRNNLFDDETDDP